MALPEIVTRDQWTAARKELLEREKEMTRARDALVADRRRLPMVRVEKEYVFQAPEGEVSLLDLFEGRRQLIVGHVMFDPAWEDGCPSCSAGMDEMSQGLLDHLAQRDTSMVYVSRGPLEKLLDWRERRGWPWRWVSSYGSDFNYDYGVTLDPSRGATEYNWRPNDMEGEMPGSSCFLRDGDDVFHTYSSYARGQEWLGGSYYWLDMTALGRQEEWEEPKGRADLERRTSPDFLT